MKVEKWKIGKFSSVVITDSDEGFDESTGHCDEGARKYYGGNLICESVYRFKDAVLISAAPDMLEALMNLENDDNSIPDSAWNLVQQAIKKATT